MHDGAVLCAVSLHLASRLYLLRPHSTHRCLGRGLCLKLCCCFILIALVLAGIFLAPFFQVVIPFFDSLGKVGYAIGVLIILFICGPPIGMFVKHKCCPSSNKKKKKKRAPASSNAAPSKYGDEVWNAPPDDDSSSSSWCCCCGGRSSSSRRSGRPAASARAGHDTMRQPLLDKDV